MHIRTVTYSVLAVAALLAACSRTDEHPADSAPQAVAPATPPAAQIAGAQSAQGEHVFRGTCAMCHGTGAGGAPMFKSKEDWAPRIAKGKPTLYDHALHGFAGAKGSMPARGGNTSLSDDDVKAGVDYMVSHAL